MLMTTRRNFLASALAAPNLAAKTGGKVPFKLGVASYSLREFSRADAIRMIHELGVSYVSVKEYHLRYTSSHEEIEAARKEFAAAGIKILSGGNIDLRGDEAKIRKMFEYAKAAGMPVMVCAPSHESLPVVEKMVKEFNIRTAIHNHGPEDKHFPTPQSVLEAVKNMDARMGLCIDVGHTARTGVDVVESIQFAGKRLFDMHIKDLKDFTAKASQVAVGEGKMPVKEIFAKLKQMNYAGGVMLEYEINAKNPMAGMKQSFDFMRGVIAGMG
jgi:sugar phosphate isomerase/epimerase